MEDVPEFVIQLGPSFRAAGLGIAVSAPLSGDGPVKLFGNLAVKAFNENVDYVELQDYSSSGTPSDVPKWIERRGQGEHPDGRSLHREW